MASTTITSYKVTVRDLPSAPAIVFKDSKFFSDNRPGCVLPSPTEVRANKGPSHLGFSRFDSLNLFVKYGKDITISEGQCLWAIRQHFTPNQVPVPQVYGWCEDGGEVFIYMELSQGITLENRWESLSKQDKIKICEQLQAILLSLRKLQQDPKDQFLGHINRKPLLDIVFTDNTKPSAGPFASVKQFHDWLSMLTKRGKEAHWADISLIPDPYRNFLPDDSTITFTHADLHPSNIIVSTEDPCRIVSIIDWHQSGWYPDYWEYCKTVFTADLYGDWESEYVPRFLELPDCYDAWAFYPRTLGY